MLSNTERRPEFGTHQFLQRLSLCLPSPMSGAPGCVGVSADTRAMPPIEISGDEPQVRVSIDLAAAARHRISFLRAVAESEWLHQESTLLESIRRFPHFSTRLISLIWSAFNHKLRGGFFLFAGMTSCGCR